MTTILKENGLDELDSALADCEMETGGFDRGAHNGSVVVLRPGGLLFREGDPRTHAFMVESGAICVYARRPTSTFSIEFAHPGDLVGPGYLAQHIFNARAVVESRLICLSSSEVDEMAKSDARLRDKLADAIEVEFAYVRETLANSGRQRPIERLASFLIAASRYGTHEGRDPTIISDSLKCGVVASYLALDLDELGRLLLELERRQLIEHRPPHGLVIKDLAGLDRLASGKSSDDGSQWLAQWA